GDRDVGYLASGTTALTRGMSVPDTAATNPDKNEVVQLSAFQVSTEPKTRRATSPSAKAPAPPAPRVARAPIAPTRPAPADTLLSANQPAPVTAAPPPAAPGLAPAPAATPAPAAPAPVNPFATAGRELLSLDTRPDATTEALKRAKMEETKKQLEDF